MEPSLPSHGTIQHLHCTLQHRTQSSVQILGGCPLARLFCGECVDHRPTHVFVGPMKLEGFGGFV